MGKYDKLKKHLTTKGKEMMKRELPNQKTRGSVTLSGHHKQLSDDFPSQVTPSGSKRVRYDVQVGIKGNPALAEATLYHELGHVVDMQKRRKQGTSISKIHNERRYSKTRLEQERRANEYAKPSIEKMEPHARTQAKWHRRVAINTYMHNRKVTKEGKR
mgnify:CR=1 FL=1